MDWQVLIIPLLALAVYVLGSVLGNKQQQPGPVRRPPQGRREGEAARPARRPTELDQFLQEVQRRRQLAEERAGRKAEEEPNSNAERYVKATAPPQRAPERPPPSKPNKPVVPLPALTVPVPTVVRVERAVQPSAPPLVSVERKPESETTVAAPLMPMVQPVAAARKPAPPLAAPLLSLLQSRQGLAAAVLLHEILGPPRSRANRTPASALEAIRRGSASA